MPVLDYSYDAFDNGEGHLHHMQTFQVATDSVLTGVRVKLYKTDSHSDQQLDVWREGVSAVKLADGLIANEAITTDTDGAWCEVSYGEGITLQAGTIYGLRLSPYDPLGGYVFWIGDNSYGYAYGQASYYSGAWIWLPRDNAFELLGYTLGLQKPINPTPANGSGPGVDFSAFTLSWQNGGGASGYRVKFPFAAASPLQTGTSYVVPENLRTSLKNTVVSWRVDATDDGGETWVTGDTWTFDPRPAKAGTSDPADSATGVSVNLSTLDWAAAAQADTYNVYFGTVLGTAYAGLPASTSDVPGSPLDFGKTYLWRVDSTNDFGTTKGDEWSFSTLDLVPPACSYTLIPGSSSSGPFDNPAGVEGVDWVWNGANNMRTTRRIVALANNRMWYEETS